MHGMGHADRGHDDPYQVLGVEAGASQRNIARAYHRAAQRAHPDARPGDPAAAARFQALTDAYELLSDPGRRAGYDRGYRAAGPSSLPPRPAAPGAALRRRGSAYLLGPPWHQPILAGPVLIEPPSVGPATSQHWRSRPAAAWSDPPVVLGVPAGEVWDWVW
jgi:curved DNA-binding protein CbpA